MGAGVAGRARAQQSKWRSEVSCVSRSHAPESEALRDGDFTVKIELGNTVT